MMSYEIISRKEASLAGRKRFFTGRPCVHGHIAQRFVTTGGCVACNTARAKTFASTKNVRQGRFFYPLHPDDMAAALAYCQALDLQRGVSPWSPSTPPAPTAFVMPADIARHREQLLRVLAQEEKPRPVLANDADLEQQAIDEHNAFVASRSIP